MAGTGTAVDRDLIGVISPARGRRAVGVRLTRSVATKSVTITEFIDDIDGGKADRTITFAVDGITYEIDLSKRNAAGFEKALKPYVEAARRVRRSPNKAATRGGRRGRRESGPDLAAVREWARENGHAISDRGRVPAAILEAYTAAN
jgi:hypothetical protein